MKKHGKIGIVVAVVALLLAAVLGYFVVILPNTEPRQYEDAQALLLAGQYNAAAEIFGELGEYENSPELLLECRYGMAEELLNSQQYREAITAFTELGDFKDSLPMIQDCYFALGREAVTQQDYKEAIACFLQAGDHPEVQTELDSAYYEYGHQEFLKGKYVSAKDKFDKIQTLPANAQPHFQYIEDAQEYINQQADVLADEISCYVCQCPIPPPGDTLWDVVSNYVPFQYGSAYFDDAEKTLKITARYHAGMRIYRAWETGDISSLSDDERQALQLAQELVEQAKQNSEDPLEIELYLYNWLCDNVVYESPDMEVDEETFMGLRQLNCVGALLDGKANCQGYTDAFYLLANMAGFDVCKISGTGQWEPHTWNGILLDGKLYFVDVTFGDCDAMGEKGKIYTWLNCAFDPETYTIDGGEALFPELVKDNDLSKTYYSDRECIFDTAADAVYYLLRQYKTNGKGYTHAVVQDAEVTQEDVERALKNQYQRAGVYSYNCTWLLYTYCGNSYITIEWK